MHLNFAIIKLRESYSKFQVIIYNCYFFVKLQVDSCSRDKQRNWHDLTSFKIEKGRHLPYSCSDNSCESGVDTNRPKTKCPITKHKYQKHNTQDFKMSNVTKCSMLQNVQRYKMS